MDYEQIKYEKNKDILTITLKEVPGGTRILWEYNVGGPMRYKIAEIAPAVDAMMSEQLKRLQAHLGAFEEGQGPGPGQGPGQAPGQAPGPGKPAADAPAAETPPSG